MKITIKDVLRIILVLSCVSVTQLKTADGLEFEDAIIAIPAAHREQLDRMFNQWMDNVIRARISNITDEELKFIRTKMAARCFGFRQTYTLMVQTNPSMHTKYDWINFPAEEINRTFLQHYRPALARKEQWALNRKERLRLLSPEELETLRIRIQESQKRTREKRQQTLLAITGLTVAIASYLYLKK